MHRTYQSAAGTLGTLGILGTLLAATAQPPAATPSLGARLEGYLEATVPISSGDRRQLASGSAVTRLLDSDVASEIAVFGAVWINGSPQRYVALAHDIERFERGESFRMTRKIGIPPSAADFAELRLPDDPDDLEDCVVGDCKLKMPQAWIERLRRSVDFRRPSAQTDIDVLFRDLTLEYVRAYVRDGDASLAVYADKSRPISVAEEFRSMAKGMPLLAKLPALRDHLLGYPRTSLPGSDEFLYWQDVKFGLKPTLRINHMVFSEQAGDTILASKMLYATHYFWTALELRILVPDAARGPGFWFFTVSRTRTDGLTGIIGRLVRLRVRREAQQATLNILLTTKGRLEGTLPP